MGIIYVIGGMGAQGGAGRVGLMGGLTTVEEYTPEDWQFHSVSPAGKLATKWGQIKIGGI